MRSTLLDPEHAIGMEVKGGKKEAAVLVPVYDWPNSPGLLMTERRADLRRHAGEISVPGGRRDQGEHLVDTALREAEEEIGLPAGEVEVIGALPPVGTFVTGYRINAFVGVIGAPESLALSPNPDEVEAILRAPLGGLLDTRTQRRVPQSKIPLRTDTFEAEGRLIWGATARILSHFFELVADPRRL
ncbi:MAG: NUDIX hydrolase [bacterium]